MEHIETTSRGLEHEESKRIRLGQRGDQRRQALGATPRTGLGPMQVSDRLAPAQTAITPGSRDLIEQPGSVLQYQLRPVMRNLRNPVFGREASHVHLESALEHVPVLLGIRHQSPRETRMNKLPVQIQRQAECRNPQLPALQDHKVMLVLLQSLRDLINQILLRPQHVRTQANNSLLLRLYPKLIAKPQEPSPIELHLECRRTFIRPAFTKTPQKASVIPDRKSTRLNSSHHSIS